MLPPKAALPAAHFVQWREPVEFAANPEGQETQEQLLSAPSESRYFPVSQSSQLVLPAVSWYFP